MKNIVTVCLLLFSLVIFSQNNKQRAERLSGSIEKQLGLSKEQKSKVYELLLSKMNSIDKAVKENNNDITAQAVMIEKRKFFSEMSSVLTQEQFQNWQRIRSEQLSSFKNGEAIQDMIFDPGMETVIKN